MEKRKHLFLL